MKTIGPQKEWLGTYRFNPRGVFPVVVTFTDIIWVLILITKGGTQI